jgi:outer membrane protein assembly factor BamB
MRSTSLIIAALALCSLAWSAAAERQTNWPNWRGPYQNGSSDATNLPVEFSPDKNVKWVIDMPGEGAGTPILWGDRVFLSSMDDRTREIVAMCVNQSDGSVLWRHVVGIGYKTGQDNNMASPSPVTDGKQVFFLFGTGDLVAYDLDGKEQWRRKIQDEGDDRIRIAFGYSASPLLHDGKLIIPMLQRGTSYLRAIDAATGKDVWRVERPSEARAESLESYSTPILYHSKDGPQIVLTGGDLFTGHDPKTGKELWRWDHYNPSRIGHWRIVVSATPGPRDANLIFASAPKGAPLFALPTDKRGELDKDAPRWEFGANAPDVPTATYYQDRLYVLDDRRKVLTCLNPLTGEVVWRGELGGRPVFRASPVAADGKIYCMNVDGEVWVVQAGDEYKLLHRTRMSDRGRAWASIAVTDGHLFIRTADKLYCIASE